MAGNAGHVMNLANSIIGVGLLAMPFCFKQCGITLAIAMLLLSSAISKLACQFLIKSSALCRRRNFEFVAFYAFGSSGKLLVELGIIGFLMGTCVAFFVVMGDLGPAIISKILNVKNDTALRTSVLIALGIFVILPLGLLRNIESLVAISTATIGFYFLFTLKIFFESSQHLSTGDWWNNVNFWNPEGVLQCIPIFAMSLSCQMQLFEIYESLQSPTVDKINAVVHSALNLCTAVYASVGLLGYIAYCKATFSGNILLSFTPSVSSEMFKLGFVMSIALSFPLVIFPCRASLYSLIFKRMPIHHEVSQLSSHIPDSRFKWLTIGIVMVSLVTGLLIPSIELVLGFVGSIIGIAICVIFPSLAYLTLNNKSANDKTVAKITVFVGILIMVMGTVGNLLAAVERHSHSKSANLNHMQDLNRKVEPAIVQLAIKTPQQIPDLDSRFRLTGGKSRPIASSGISGKKEKVVENQRKEPPVPEAPAVDIKGVRKSGVSRSGNAKMKVARDSGVKLIENISKDAIEKEEREILEVEKLKRSEEGEKDRELRKVIKEQEEQKKLLREQEKILMEVKNREMKNEEKLNKILREKSLAEASITAKRIQPVPAAAGGSNDGSHSEIASPAKRRQTLKKNPTVDQLKPHLIISDLPSSTLIPLPPESMRGSPAESVSAPVQRPASIHLFGPGMENLDPGTKKSVLIGKKSLSKTLAEAGDKDSEVREKRSLKEGKNTVMVTTAPAFGSADVEKCRKTGKGASESESLIRTSEHVSVPLTAPDTNPISGNYLVNAAFRESIMGKKKDSRFTAAAGNLR